MGINWGLEVINRYESNVCNTGLRVGCTSPSPVQCPLAACTSCACNNNKEGLLALFLVLCASMHAHDCTPKQHHDVTPSDLAYKAVHARCLCNAWTHKWRQPGGSHAVPRLIVCWTGVMLLKSATLRHFCIATVQHSLLLVCKHVSAEMFWQPRDAAWVCHLSPQFHKHSVLGCLCISVTCPFALTLGPLAPPRSPPPPCLPHFIPQSLLCYKQLTLN